MNTDLTFITNEGGQDLARRFSELIKDTRYFDILVGYFYASGFYLLYKELEKTEKIRVLVGIGTDVDIFSAVKIAEGKKQMKLSHYESKEEFKEKVVKEMDLSKDSPEVEEGIRKFIEWLEKGKIEIRVYPKEQIHAKLYIMTFKEGDRDVGRVITGSSNFSRFGLKSNIEFNVELKNRSDYEFALEKFNELWEEGVDVSEAYVQTIREKTWLNDEITPYELFLKFLYEYFKEEINLDKYSSEFVLPKGFMNLKYQRDAVSQAKKIIEQHGGVFLADVVGLGKTYMAAMLAKELGGRTLVIAPPSLLKEDVPGSWPSVMLDFGIPSKCESIGKLEKILKDEHEYQNVIIDESHRFRNEMTQMYGSLYQICKGKRVILVSATPLNNSPMDILAQLKLFQKAHRSTLPNPKVRDLEVYFKKLQKKLKGLDRVKDREKYLKVVKENSEDIRKNVLRYLMVRRTRSAIVKYYKKDMKKQGLKFPEVQDPIPLVYEFDEELNEIFDKTLHIIVNEFTYARYTPLLYLKKKLTTLEEQSQKNMGGFMKILLLKRLESSFYAFKQTINRFIKSYEGFIDAYNKGKVFTSKHHMSKLLELIDKDDFGSIEKIINEGKAEEYNAKDFRGEFLDDLQHDLEMLKKIKELWSRVDRDPKIELLKKQLSEDKILKKSKIIIFTESKETAEYIKKNLDKMPSLKGIMVFSSFSSSKDRLKITENFDANVKKREWKDDVRILITTDVLSEGVNLHRSNVVINYDIPWNPVRMIQRVGRVNRIAKDLPFSKIYIYNFFPTGPINERIGLKEAAEAKIRAIIEMLGNDARLLTDEEIKSHELFVKLTRKETIVGEEEVDEELEYLNLIRKIRDENQELFEKVKKLPKKARTARKYEDINENALITFFRKGRIKKILLAKGEHEVREVDFGEAIGILKVKKNARREKIKGDFYKLLDKNKKHFDSIVEGFELEPLERKGGRDSESQLINIIKAVLKNSRTLTEDEEEYLIEVKKALEEGDIPKQTIKKVRKSIKDTDPHSIYKAIRDGIPTSLLKAIKYEEYEDNKAMREVILSEYLIKKEVAG